MKVRNLTPRIFCTRCFARKVRDLTFCTWAWKDIRIWISKFSKRCISFCREYWRISSRCSWGEWLAMSNNIWRQLSYLFSLPLLTLMQRRKCSKVGFLLAGRKGSMMWVLRNLRARTWTWPTKKSGISTWSWCTWCGWGTTRIWRQLTQSSCWLRSRRSWRRIRAVKSIQSGFLLFWNCSVFSSSWPRIKTSSRLCSTRR